MARTFVLVCSDMDKTPLQWMSEHDGYCANTAEILQQFKELREFGHRFQGAWKVTVEKVNPRAVKTWRKIALSDGDSREG